MSPQGAWRTGGFPTLAVRVVVLALIVPVLFAAPGAGFSPKAVYHLGAGGEAGAWNVYFFPFDTPATSVSLTVSLELETFDSDEAADTAWLLPPMLLVDREGGPVLVEAGATAVVSKAVVGSALIDVEYGVGVWTSGILGLVVAATADDLHVLRGHVIVLSADTTVAQSPYGIRTSGGGASITPALLPPVPVAGRSELVLPLAEPGWTHLASEAFHAQPVGLRSFDVRFPNGFRVAGTGQMTGANAVLLGFSSSSSYWGGLGHTGNVPGTLRAGVTYVEASTGVQFVAIHLPTAASPLPASIANVGYRNFDGGLDVRAPSVSL